MSTPRPLPVAEANALPLLPSVIQNPWAPPPQSVLSAQDIASSPPDSRIVIVGTGLTAVDVVMSLWRRGYPGQMLAIAPRPHWPMAHHTNPLPPVPPALPPIITAQSLTRAIRQQAEEAYDWRSVIDGLRPVTAQLWHGMADTEKSRLIRHVLRHWNRHRHRMAPNIAHHIAELETSGQLVRHAGRIEALHPRALDRVDIRLHGQKETLPCMAVINATGPDKSASSDPLLAKLLRRTLASPTALGWGIAADETGKLSPNLPIYALGPALAGEWLESFAVPDIRKQAEQLAAIVAND